jgi:hypothetical protein
VLDQPSQLPATVLPLSAPANVAALAYLITTLMRTLTVAVTAVVLPQPNENPAITPSHHPSFQMLSDGDSDAG